MLGGRRPTLRGIEDAAVLECHAAAVHRFCSSRISNAADAEDAAQSTFVRFLRRRRAKVAAPGGWLIHAARLSFAELRRQQRRAQDIGSAAFSASEAADPEERVTDRLMLERVLAGLAPSDRELLMLLHVQGLSSEEVGHKLGLSAGNVRVRGSRIRELVRREARRIGWAPGVMPVPLDRLWHRTKTSMRSWSHTLAQSPILCQLQTEWAAAIIALATVLPVYGNAFPPLGSSAQARGAVEATAAPPPAAASAVVGAQRALLTSEPGSVGPLESSRPSSTDLATQASGIAPPDAGRRAGGGPGRPLLVPSPPSGTPRRVLPQALQSEGSSARSIHQRTPRQRPWGSNR